MDNKFLKTLAPIGTQIITTATTAQGTSTAIGAIGSVAEVTCGSLATWIKFSPTTAPTTSVSSHDKELVPGESFRWEIEARSLFIGTCAVAGGGSRVAVGVVCP